MDARIPRLLTRVTTDPTAPRLVVAMSDEPSVHELWTVNRLAGLPCRLAVVTVPPVDSRPVAGFGGTLRRPGFGRAVSRLIGAHVVGRLYRRRERRQLESLFDAGHLRRWWQAAGIDRVPAADVPGAQAAIARLRPGIVVLASDAVFGDEFRSLAGITTLAVHHGLVPRVCGPVSIPWGIIEGRVDWIGATISEVERVEERGRIVWRGTPPAACGDTAVTLLFRAHMEAVEALAGLIREYAAGNAVPGVACEAEPSIHRAAPGARSWVRYLRARGRRRAAVLLQTALR